MTFVQGVIVTLLIVGIGSLLLAAWLGRPWDVDGGEYTDDNGISYGRMEPKA